MTLQTERQRNGLDTGLYYKSRTEHAYRRRNVASFEFVQPKPSSNVKNKSTNRSIHPQSKISSEVLYKRLKKRNFKQRPANPQSLFHGINEQQSSSVVAKISSKEAHQIAVKNNVAKNSSVFVPRRLAKINISRYHLMTACAGLLFVMGVAVSLQTFLTNKQVVDQVQAVAGASEEISSNEVVENSLEIPDETSSDPSSLSSYVVAADMPRFLKIPKIGVMSRILPLGVDQDNQLRAPSNIYDVGWYNGSNKPGEPGTALMDGHVSGPTRNGVFYDLEKLVVGDTIEVERGDSSIVAYRVVDTRSFHKDSVDMLAALKSSELGKNGLNLITCSGKFNAAENSYEERLIVFAVEV